MHSEIAWNFNFAHVMLQYTHTLYILEGMTHVTLREFVTFAFAFTSFESLDRRTEFQLAWSLWCPGGCVLGSTVASAVSHVKS